MQIYSNLLYYIIPTYVPFVENMQFIINIVQMFSQVLELRSSHCLNMVLAAKCLSSSLINVDIARFTVSFVTPTVFWLDIWGLIIKT